jgi:hypothetical protein
MDRTAFRGLDKAIRGLTVLAIIGVVALVVGLGWLLWMAFTVGGWWAYAAFFLAGWTAHAWVNVLLGES